MVELSSLPAPVMIAAVDAEAIIARMAASFTAWALDEYGVDVTGIVSLEGEPLAVQMEFYAYQEAQMRAAFNDVLKSNLLFFAAGTDLDHIAADHGVTRLSGEADAALRSRIVLSDQGNSAAGPEEWYEFHARSASVEVADVAVYRTGAGPEIEVSVLSTGEGGVPSAELLALVSAAVTSPSVRSINDIVSVVAATKITVDLTADVWLLPETPTTVFDGLEQGLRTALDTEGGIGFDINRSWVQARLMASGVAKVELSMAADVLVDDHTAARFGTIALTYRGRLR
ncbi:MAG: baseplate J/gp47 family protein [Rhizobium sp.]|nr:baseplate J/gp47 family protein [Rhizobium sp.]